MTVRSSQRSAWLAAMVAAAVLCAVAPADARPDGSGEMGALSANAPISVESRAAREELPLGTPVASGVERLRGDSPASSRDNWVMQTVLALGGVLALAMVASIIVRTIARGQGGLRAALGAGGSAPAGLLEVIGRYPIARGSSLVLLKLDRRILLLSQSSQGRLGAGAAFTTLCEINDPEEVASILVRSRDAEGDSMSERFRGMLGRFDRNMEASDEAPDERRRHISAGGDRVELWNESRGDIPLVDLTRERPPGQPTGTIASLRQRLASLRTTEGGRAS